MFYDDDINDEMEWLIKCLKEDKVPFKASLNINSENRKAYGYITNFRVSVTIKKINKKLFFTVRDEGIVNHARMEGFSEEEIRTKIKCIYEVDAATAEILLTKPGFMQECKMDIVKDNIVNIEKNNT